MCIIHDVCKSITFNANFAETIASGVYITENKYHIQPYMSTLWSQINILDYWIIIVFLVIILLYSLERLIYTGTKQQIWLRFHCNNGVSGTY